MAKKKMVQAKKLLPPREVVVKSRAYGAHTRAARGTKTPVSLNDSFQKYNTRTAVVNGTAKRLLPFLKASGKGFAESMLWQGMLSRMRSADTEDVLLLLKSLEGLELNSRYPLSRLARPFVYVEKGETGELLVTVRNGAPRRMKNGDTAYAYEAYLLLLGGKPDDDTMMEWVSEWRMVGVDSPDQVRFSFLLPPEMKYWLLVLHVMGGKEKKATGTLASRGMRVVSCGEVG